MLLSARAQQFFPSYIRDVLLGVVQKYPQALFTQLRTLIHELRGTVGNAQLYDPLAQQQQLRKSAKLAKSRFVLVAA